MSEAAAFSPFASHLGRAGTGLTRPYTAVPGTGAILAMNGRFVVLPGSRASKPQ